MKLRLLSLFVAGALAGALATTGMQVYADKQAETKLPLMEVRQFTSVFNAVKDYYVDEVSDKELLELAVEGMVSGLDPHSSFLDPEGFEDMSEATHGSFGGLGIEVTKDVSGVRVISPIDDTPAARAGIRAGDIITKLDGDTRGGAALSIRAVTGKPILYVGMGEKLEDLQQFYPERMTSRILGMGDVFTLIEKAENAVDEEEARKLEQKK